MEYVIWGRPPGATEETLLLARVEGETINDRQAAQRYAGVLEQKHGCTKTRIQEINLAAPLDFLQTAGL